MRNKDSLKPTESAEVDFDNPLDSRRYRLKSAKTLKTKLIRKLGDLIESFIAKQSLYLDVAVYDHSIFPWVARVENCWCDIRKELDKLMLRRELLPNFQDIMGKVGTITQDDRWKTFFLIAPGMDCRENQAQCPRTMRALREIPEIQTAFFSILSPRKHIPAHRGPFNGVLRYHLGLIVPEIEDCCRIRIGKGIYHWQEGRSLIFDDTYNHEVWNDTDSYRVVLFVDFMRPMRIPHSWWMKGLLKLAARTPFLKEADYQQQAWAKKFYHR